MQNNHSKRWKVQPPVPAEIDRALGTYPRFFRQVLYNRGHIGLDTAQRFLEASGDPYDPFQLKGMDIAVDRLLRAIDSGERVAVYGDYDVDGVTATVLLTQALRALGADAIPYIPNRFDEGYGLNNEALDRLVESGVKVVVTVDCGVRSSAEVEHGCAAGLDVIVSDHHSPLGDLPPAIAVICQRQEGDQYPDKNLAGVGLAYKIAQALFSQRSGLNARPEDWLDLVALGTVADVVPLTGENRILVRGGLKCIRTGCRRGVTSLANVAGIDVSRCNAGDIGFILGPRLNAAGRIESALLSVDLLMSSDVLAAGPLAQKLDDKNRERQELTRQMQARAEEMIRAQEKDHILFAFDTEFNPGVVGLVAARMAESRYRPAVIGYRGEEFTRASCRSIEEFHITNALDQCADLMVRHGGHAKAAGFTVRNENLSELISRLSAIAEAELGGRDLRPALRADVEVSFMELNPFEVFKHLDLLEPTGLENPEVTFVSRNVIPFDVRAVGADSSHLRLKVKQDFYFPAIAFRQGYWAGKLPERIDILFTMERNTFNGRTEPQLNIRDIKPAGIPD